MRVLVTAAFWLSFTAQGAAFDRARVLLSDHTVLCSPNTPVVTASHLVGTWGAMVCVVSTEANATDERLRPWVAEELFLDPSSETAVDSLAAWKTRLRVSTVVVVNDQRLAEAARQAGLSVFVQTQEFRQGGLALPNGRDFVYYNGPSPVFFDRQGGLAESGSGSLRSRDGWGKLATRLSEAFAPESEASETRWHTLLSATHTADSLAALRGADPRSTGYAERWRHCLSWWLAPTVVEDSLHLFVGLEEAHTIRLLKGQGEVTLAGIHSDRGDVMATWSTAESLKIDSDTTLVQGIFSAMRAGSRQWTGNFEFLFDNFRFVRSFSFPVHVEAALGATLVPWVLFADGPLARSDPDFDVQAFPGQLELRNSSASPLKVILNWKAESPGHLSSTTSELDLAPGERKRTGFTLTLPKDIEQKVYEFAVDLSVGGASTTVRGQVWKNAPKKTGPGRIGMVGTSGAWLRALPDLGLKVTDITPGRVAEHLKSLDAVVIRGGTRPAGEGDMRALADFVAEGNVAVLEIDNDALTWLPWLVETVRKPAPYAASFHKEDLAWWLSPNGLVGGCFAAVQRDSVLTLPAGEIGWEPLLVDEQGKGFMYRRHSGRGWYVLVHAGWWPRLEQLERRAHLGLINLVSASTQ